MPHLRMLFSSWRRYRPSISNKRKKGIVKIFVESENMDDLVVIKNKVKEFTQSDLDNLIYSGTKKDFKLSGTQYKQLELP